MFNVVRMTYRGPVTAWDLSAVMVLLWVPDSKSINQIGHVLMNGVPTSVGMKYLKHADEP